jgi:hypothetical protein
MIVTETTSSFEPCPSGSYLARLCRLIDLGTQTSEYLGETKTARKALLTWEVVDPETHLDDGRSYTVAKRYTMSLHEKSALRRDLASWRGRDFTPDELRGFDVATVLGKTCLLSVVHASKDGRTFANVASVLKPPKGLEASEPTEALVHFDLSAPDWQVFNALTQRLQDQIAGSPEFKAARSVAAAPPTSGGEPDDPDSDIPW